MRSPIPSLSAVLLLFAAHTVALASPTLTASGTAGATSLGMDGLGNASTHVVRIGVVSASTSGPNGFTLSVSSGSLAKADGSTPIAFQVVLVDRDATPPSSAAFTTPSGMTYTLVMLTAAAVDKDLYIKYTPRSLQDPGPYSASVELGIVDN